MFKPNAFHLALAASLALAMSAGARGDDSQSLGNGPSLGGAPSTPDATLTPVKTPAPAPAPAPCDGDITGDRSVNVLDLIEVVMGWGACPIEPGPYPLIDSDVASVNTQGGKDDVAPSLSDNGRDKDGDDGELAQVLPCHADITGDGYVDVQDMIQVLLNYGSTCP
ncbi:MAG: hypothetical protein ACYSTY_09720 [Planctomycetota bacterium]|jgi:hypothetical protein